MSRSNLERVIDQFKLFSDPKAANMLMEDKLESLRKRIKVEVGRASPDEAGRRTRFPSYFRDTDPQTTMKVANGLATFFIDENLKSREGMAVGTSDFLDSELESMRKRLEEQEQLLKKFREKNMGELPEQLDSNLRILDSLNTQLTQKEDSLRNARVSLAALESEMSIRQGAIAAMLPPPGPAATGRENEDQMSLDQLKDKLAGLRASYTDQHPDVVRLKTRIDRLEKEQASAPPASDKAGGRRNDRATCFGPAQRGDARQKTVLLGAIRALEAEIARINQRDPGPPAPDRGHPPARTGAADHQARLRKHQGLLQLAVEPQARGRHRPSTWKRSRRASSSMSSMWPVCRKSRSRLTCPSFS